MGEDASAGDQDGAVYDDMGSEEGEAEEVDMDTNIEAKREQAISDLLKKEDLGLI